MCHFGAWALLPLHGAAASGRVRFGAWALVLLQGVAARCPWLRFGLSDQEWLYMDKMWLSEWQADSALGARSWPRKPGRAGISRDLVMKSSWTRRHESRAGEGCGELGCVSKINQRKAD